MPTINVQNLQKVFKRRKKGSKGFWGNLSELLNPKYELKTAVNDISFCIERGEIVGYIGPNGAGKSTTIKMLAGILVPTSGTLEVGGCVPWHERSIHARHIGVVFGQRTHLWWDVPVIDSMHLLRDIYDVPETRFRNNLALFEDLLGINEFLSVPVRQLSLGQRVRADIAAALMHDPDILFLDEPTIGVDAVSKDRLRAFIKEINHNRKVTILLTTHDLNEIEKLCSRVIIIDHGKLLYDGSLEQIRSQYSNERIVVIEFEEDIPDFSLPFVTHQRSEGRKKWFTFKRYQTSASDIIQLVSSQYPVRDLTIEEPEIEKVISEIYLDKAERMH